MQISEGVLTAGISFVFSASIAYGILKGKLPSFLTHKEHAELCKIERKETEKTLQDIRQTQLDIHGKISEIHGYMKAKGL